MRGCERHQAVVEAVHVVNPMLDNIFVHRANEPSRGDRFADLLFHVNLAEVVSRFKADEAGAFQLVALLPTPYPDLPMGR
jgi:hypothetical protein